MKYLIRDIVVLAHISIVLCTDTIQQFTTDSLVASSIEHSSEDISEEESKNVRPAPAKIYEMNIMTVVSNRFATTEVISKVQNFYDTSREATFSVIIPDTAYISGFVMDINGKSYKAYVKEKEEAKQIYSKAIGSGLAAAHVESSVRDSNRFTVSVNVEPQSKATFRLTYDELLQRQGGKYEIVTNIHPGQPLKQLNVEVFINESRPIKFARTPSLRTGNEISRDDDKLDSSAKINITGRTAVIKFNPDEEKQKMYAAYLGTNANNGFAGQFVVQYDVERDPNGGEILLNDGYFVHFFAPSELSPLLKYVVFVLDTSGSMEGTRIKQLQEAMNSILSELKPKDLFSIVLFASDVNVWNVEEGKLENTHEEDLNGMDQTLPEASVAHTRNILKAKTAIAILKADGGTNIQSALKVALQLIAKAKRDGHSSHQPMVMFLTDGEPTTGQTNKQEITSTITELNSGETRSPIFSLSFGDAADRGFLQEISLKNSGFSRHIYEAADASLQLHEFYNQISSPLLTNVSFKYIPDNNKLTRIKFPIFFSGSEIVICGNTELALKDFVPPKIYGHGFNGSIIEFVPTVEPARGSLEKLWAYLTVKQLLEQRDASDNKTFYTKKALDIALKYSFVTPVSSLVVVSNGTDKALDTVDASRNQREFEISPQYSGSTSSFSSLNLGPIFPISFFTVMLVTY